MALFSNKFRRAFSRTWPMPNVDGAVEPKLLLLLTPPNSGSTAIADFLAQIPNSIGLTPNYEGQRLVKGLSSRARWTPERDINVTSVRAVWLKFVEGVRAQGKAVDYVIEKSPANMVRYRQIQQVFSDTTTVCNNRNPFANCASLAFRYHGFENLPSDERHRRSTSIARNWVRRSEFIAEAVTKSNLPLLTYEEFCANPLRIFEMFGLDVSHLNTANATYKVHVKDYADQPIMNMNARQVSKLSAAEIDAITSVLAPHEDLLRIFGYSLDPSALGT